MGEWGEPREVEVDGRVVRLSNPDKVMFHAAGVTKGALVDYYLAIRGPFLAAVGGRPAMLQRFPNGVGGKSFYQKRVPSGAPDWLSTAEMATPNGTTSNALVLADMAHTVWAVNLGCLGFHVWPCYDIADVVDELRIDLDPQPKVSFAQVADAALACRELLSELGWNGYVKTSGNTGLHVHVSVDPPRSAIDVRRAAVAIARRLEERHPDLVTARWWKEERGERVFVDFNQNAPHKTMFGAYSARARVGAQVSTPLAWDEVGILDPAELTVDTVPQLVVDRGDPWRDRGNDGVDIQPLVDEFLEAVGAGVPDEPWPPVYPKQPDEAPRVAPSRARRPSGGTDF